MNEWISVKDKMPAAITHFPHCSFSNDVLVIDRGGNAYVTMFVFDQTPDGVSGWDDRDLDFDSADVTHWMPLPELPTSEEVTE